MRASSLGNQNQKIPRIEVELGKINDTIATVSAFLTSFKRSILGSARLMVYTNPQTINENLEIPALSNALSVGDITIQTGSKVTVTEGSVWKII